jgi:PKD repeat protein
MNFRANGSTRWWVGMLLIITVLAPLFVNAPAQAAVTFPIKINFQNSTAPVPAGYFRDYGQPYGLRTDTNQGSGYTYGWVDPITKAPLNLAVGGSQPGNGRRRNANPDLRYDTLMHMQADDVSGFNGTPAEGAWEIEIPNGTYNVTVAVGDAQANNPVESHTVRVEGTVAIANFASTGTNGEISRHRTRTIQVVVSDGRLTLDAIGGTNTKINFVDIEVGGELPRPKINNITPANGTTGVRRDVTVVAGITPAQADINLTTVNTTTVYLIRNSDNARIDASVNTTAGGDSISLRPLDFLDPNTIYTFHVSDGVKDNAGQSMVPASSTFTTGTAGGPGGGGGGIAFEQVKNVASGTLFSSLTIGPDGKLYVATLEGYIIRYTINPDGTLTGAQTINTIRMNENGDRAIIGLVFDPTSTAANLILWVSHNGEYIQSAAPDWTGKIARLSGANLENFQNYVVNLPHSYKDHMLNSLAFGPDGKLYANVGSNTAMGAPDTAWGQRPERLLSAAVLQIDLATITNPPLDVKTEAGGSYNPFDPNAPVKLFATGVRNAYDLVWHTNGQLYVPTNGSASGGNTPATPTTLPVACQNRIDKATNGNYTGPAVAGLNGVGQTQKDWLFRVVQGGYYGHPNPTRCEWVMNGGNPTAGAGNDGPTEVPGYPSGTQPDRNYRGASYNFELNKSPNGAIEYRSNVFNGALTGRLLVVRYSGEDDIIVLEPGGANKDIINSIEKLPGLTGFNNPLDLIENRTNGNIYVIEHGPPSRITLLKPIVGSLPTITINPSQLIFTDIAGGAASATQSVTIRNDGTATLNISNVQIVGSQAAQFQVVGTLPTTIAPQGSATVQVAFNPAIAGPHLALLRISSNAANVATAEVVLRGLGTLGNGGANEPSLQWILDTYEIKVNVGDPDPTNNALPTTPLLGEEVALQRFERADNANPVIVEPLAVFGPTGNNPIVRFGWYTSGNAAAKNEIFNVTNTPTSNGQRINPVLDGATAPLTFDPGTGSFGFYSIWPAFGNREVFSEDALNTFGGAIPHHVRVYPLKDASGTTVPNAYVVATEETTSGFDYQDVVVIVRNVRPFGTGQGGSPPQAPANVTATAGNGQVVLNWAAGSGTPPATYEIYRSTTSPVSTAGAPIATITQTTYTDTGLVNGTTYYYAIIAVSASGQKSPPSTEVNANPFLPGGTIMIENLDRIPYNDRLVFNRIHGTGLAVHRLVTLRIHNIGTTDLNVSQITINGPDAQYFMVNGFAGPYQIQPSTFRDVVFCMKIIKDSCSAFEGGQTVSATPITALRFASASIVSSDPVRPNITIELAGAEQKNNGGIEEPTLQEIMDVFGYKVKTRFTNEGVSLKGPPPTGTRQALGDEVISDYWVRASDKAPVYVRQLASLQGSGNPAFRLQGGGCSDSNCEISVFGEDWQSFLPRTNVTTAPRPPAEMTVNPNGQFQIIAAGFSTLTGTPQNKPHGLRIYPVRDRNGVIVQNTYIVGQDYIGSAYPVTSTSPNFDYQDNVYLITNVRPTNITKDLTHPALFPGMPNLVLEFDKTYPGTLVDAANNGTGFIDTLRNKVDNKQPQSPPTSSYTSTLLSLNPTGQGTLTVTTSDGHLSSSDNAHKNALCTPFDGRTAKFVMQTRIMGPLALSRALQQGGLFFGPDYDHYVKLVVGVFSGTTPAIQFAQEMNGTSPAAVGPNVSLANQTINFIDLQLTADPATGVIEAAYSINGGQLQTMPGAVTLTGSDRSRFFDRNTRGCLFTTHKNASQTNFVFDRFAITLAPELTAPRNVLRRYNIGGPTVNANGKTWLTDAGTFTPATAPNEDPAGTFAISNTDDDQIYQDYRGNVGNATPQASRIITYELPIGTNDPKLVAVRLHFAEMYWGRTGGGPAGPGRRIFDTTIEGIPVLPDFDISGATGGAATTAVVVPIENIQVNDGNLTIVQKADVDFSALSAVEILEQPDGSPVVEAGNNQNVPINAQVTLTGSVITNNTPPLTYVWEQTGGAQVQLNASGATATFIAPNGYAQLEFRLTVTNGFGKSGSDIVTIIVGDDPITGLSLTSNTPKAINQAVTFTAAISTGVNVVYTWDFGNGTTPITSTTPTINYTYLVAGSYQATVTASNSTSSASASTTVTILPFPPFELRINGGGGTVTTSGKQWVSDTTPTKYYNTGSTTTVAASTAIANTDDDVLFRTERYSKNMTYSIPVPAQDNYIVKLYFAEIFHNAANARIFDVNIEGGAIELDNFDVFAAAGGKNVAIMRQFTINSGTDSVITINFNSNTNVGGKDNAKISAIEVIRVLNLPPTVNAGPDQTVQPGTLVQLNGTVSDPEGFEVVYGWSQTAGPTVTLSNSTTLAPTFTPTLKGTYTFKLTGTDGQGASSSDFVTIVVPNRAPFISSITATPSPVEVNGSVALAVAATDADNDTLTYIWQQIGGPVPVTINGGNTNAASFTATQKGTYTFRATVNDGDTGGITTATVTVVVNNRAPVANPSANPSPAEVNDTVTLDANASDADGDNLTYLWQQVTGPQSVSLSNTASEAPTFTAPAKGTYEFSVTVTDGDTGSVTATVSVVVNNRLPIADAGADQSANVGTIVQLDGRGSSDPDGDSLLYAWEQIAGTPVTLANADTSTPTFTAPAQPEELQFKLVVTDTENASSTPDIVIISIGEVAIENLNIITDAPTVLGQTTSFTASVTIGSNVSYSWNFGDGNTAVGISVNHTFVAAGTYTVTLVATNSLGTETVETLVTITNDAPIADAAGDQAVLVNELVTLNGLSSTDPDGHLPLTYSWIQTGGPEVTLSGNDSPTPTFTAPAMVAVLAFQLIVTDSFGLVSEPDSVLIIVTDSAPGSAQATNDGPTTLGNATTLSATAEGTNLTYDWNFGDQQTGSGDIVTHTYALEGTYIAVVSVTNTTGGVEIAMTGVTIVNEAPIADAGLDIDVPILTAASLNANASFDPDGHAPLTFAWQQIGGTPVRITGASSPAISFTTPEQTGTLIFRVTVFDSYGKRSSDTVRINVVDAAVSGLTSTSTTPTVLGQATLFTASVATGTNVGYIWDFGDGNIGSGANIQHVYTAEGNYVVSVTASNGTSSANMTLNVLVTNSAPIANAGADQVVSGSTSVTLSGEGSDPDGHTPLTFNWQQVSGQPVLASSNGPVATFVSPAAGPVVMVFKLTVTDAYGKSSSDFVEVRVEGEPRRTYNLFLPMMYGRPGNTGPTEPTLQPADLVITRFEVTPTTPAPEQPVLITVEVKNQGDQPTGAFWVDLYINPNRPPTSAGRPWESTCTLDPCYGMAWFVAGGLQPGQSVVLTSTPESYYADNTIWQGSFAPGTRNLYVYADSWNQTNPNGVVTESNETNNRAELLLQSTASTPIEVTDGTTEAPVLPDRSVR